MEQLFLIVARNIDGEVIIKKENDIIKAVAKQKDMLVGCGMELAMSLVTKEEIQGVTERLKKCRMDRIYNDEEEVTIIFFPGKS